MPINNVNTMVRNTINAIRNDASEDYRAHIRELGANDSITEIGNSILNYQPAANEFISALINRIAFTIIENKMWNNRLGVLKKSRAVPLGTDIQHIYTNPINPMGYDGENLSGILSTYKTDTKVAYYRRNRQDVFPLTINKEELQGAFVSYEAFDNFLSGKINAVYSGNEIREYNLFKESIVNAYANNILLGKRISYPRTKDEANQLVAEIKNLAVDFTYPSIRFNNYINQPGAIGEAVETWCDTTNIVIIMRSDLISTLSVKVLASAFNISEVEFRNNLIVVDDFGYDIYDTTPSVRKRVGRKDSDIGFVICDKTLFQVYNNIERSASDFIASSLSWQFFFHVWQIYGICPFANCMVYEVPRVEGITNFSITNYNNPDGEDFIDLTGEKTEQNVTYQIVPDKDLIINDVSLEIVNILESEARATITPDNLSEYLSITYIDNNNKTMTFASTTSSTEGKTASLILNLVVDGYKYPILATVNFI